MVSDGTRFRWRDLLVHVVLFACAFVLVARLLYVQVLAQERYASRANRQQVSEEVIHARPGDILDRKGRLLATTVTVPSLYVNPSRIKKLDSYALSLAYALDLDGDALSERMQKQHDKQFLWVKRKLSDDELSAVNELDLPTGTFGFRNEYQRHYPQGHLAAHVLGLRDIDGTGRGGVEETLDDLLQGKNGVRRFVRDARGYVLDVLEEVTDAPEDGRDAILSLDMVVQLNVENELDALMEEHKPIGASAIVLDPRTSEVIAMASRPTFDPNDPNNVPDAAWTNRAIASVYEPGSTFKPLVVGWALSHDVIERGTMFDCERGAYRMGPRVLHDHHPYSGLSLTDVLVKSSNIGMAKIGERLGNPQLHQCVTDFGFGQRTGIELPGELPGLLRPLSKWDIYSTGSIPMGQELAATPLQIIAAHGALANRGRKLSPHLFIGTTHRDREPRQIVTSEIVNPSHASWVIAEPMLQVVERGTGKNGAVAGLDVFGKTGTAQKIDESGQYSRTKSVCSFICGAPALAPQLLVLVTIDEPHGPARFGGTTAAPTAASILQHALRIHR